MGAEWQPMPFVAWRVGYRTDTTGGLSPLAGFSTGLGLRMWGQEFSYAWLPLGDLGSGQYFSFVCRFGETLDQEGNLMPRHAWKKEYEARQPKAKPVEESPEFEQLMQLLNETSPPEKEGGK